jgi:hypothetical protein
MLIATRPCRPFHDAHHLGNARRHEVHDGDHAGPGLELGLEHERVVAVRPPDARHGAGRRETPAAVGLGTQQGGEAGRVIEPGQAQPVDGAVAADQRRGLAIADHRVVLDRQRRHGAVRVTSSAWA